LINIEERIALARRTLYSLIKTGVHGTNGLNPRTSCKIYQVYVIPRLLYGLETLFKFILFFCYPVYLSFSYSLYNGIALDWVYLESMVSCIIEYYVYHFLHTGVHGTNGLNPRASCKIYQVYVIPRLLYGLETLNLKKKDIATLSSFHIGYVLPIEIPML
jgi:hypothetical protein